MSADLLLAAPAPGTATPGTPTRGTATGARGRHPLLAAVGGVLVAAGVRPSPRASKLAFALSARLADEGAAVLVSSHVMDEADGLGAAGQ